MKNRTFILKMTTVTLLWILACTPVHANDEPAASSCETLDSITLDRNDYLPDQYLCVTCSGVAASAVEQGAWVAVARPEEDAGNYLDWKYVTEGDCMLWLPVPGETGQYEVRYYAASRADEDNLAEGLRIPFSVSGERPGNDAPVYPEKNEFNWDLLEYMPGSYSWTGTYETNFRTLYLRQDGSTVIGEYPDWDNGRLDGIIQDGILYGYWYESPSYAPEADAGQLIFARYPDGEGFQGWWRYGNSGMWRDWSAGTLNRISASSWAETEVYTADSLHLLPECLRDDDLSQPITAAEFAALSVRLFEEVRQPQELLPMPAPYEDIEGHVLQTEIEKANGLGILKPIRAETFNPDEGFSREVMAAMYCNLIKACEHDDCSPETVDSFLLPYTISVHFADEAEISAENVKDSIYYLTENGLMDALADDRFGPAQDATREQAVVTALRIYGAVSEGD